ncbi:MAG: hypothetical protein LBH25_11485 [Fibromonadaceae bacterium]|jgi:hypothetical protein|nr:hypothetical protein [Fibromonadaceae bacterium]
MSAMKKTLLFSLLLMLIGCDDAKENPAIWNGKADTKWYNKNEIEFTITTPEQLAGLAKLVEGGNDFYGKTIKLGADIMLNDTADWQNWDKKAPRNEWKPIGTYIDEINGRIPDFLMDHTGSILVDAFVPEFIRRALRLTDTDLPFKGIFDGGSFVVSGVYINTLESYQGLFGYIKSYYKKTELRNLGIRASYIKGGASVGSLVGKSEGVVSGCYSTALVVGAGAGGLVGYNDYSINAIITNSYFTGTISGNSTIGGLAGVNYGAISDSYSTGAVVGNIMVGGLVGYNYGTINGSYSAGAVSGNNNVGGFVGESEGEIINSYYNMETSKSDIGKGEPRTTEELKLLFTFAGWDFANLWGIDSTANGGYPYLRNMLRKSE